MGIVYVTGLGIYLKAFGILRKAIWRPTLRVELTAGHGDLSFAVDCDAKSKWHKAKEVLVLADILPTQICTELGDNHAVCTYRSG